MQVIEILKAVLYGIVEGVTEWLPISSTGHMILLNEFVKLDVSPEFWNLFLVVIQLGAILAVVILYWKTIWPFKRVKTKSGGSRIVFRRQTFILWLKALVACIPAGIPVSAAAPSPSVSLSAVCCRIWADSSVIPNMISSSGIIIPASVSDSGPTDMSLITSIR